MIQTDFYIQMPANTTPERASADWAILTMEVNKWKRFQFPESPNSKINYGKSRKKFIEAVRNDTVDGKVIVVKLNFFKNKIKVRFVRAPIALTILELSQTGEYIDNIISASK